MTCCTSKASSRLVTRSLLQSLGSLIPCPTSCTARLYDNPLPGEGYLDMVGNNDSGVNLGAKDENERTPLHWVGAAGRLDVDEFLLGRRQHPRTRVRCFWTTGANTRGAWQESLSTAVELWGKLAYAQHYLAVPLTRSHSLASLVCCVPVALSKLGLCERYQAQPSSEEAGVPSDFFTCDGWVIHKPRDREIYRFCGRGHLLAALQDAPDPGTAP
ncbi:hypothetical protein PR001_g14103 [Phytophthora rubi]|uniref:Uncharacterized protein n=1 Tax=Phytophthora rubi TaxID=129364 RepID=A0A6A3LKB3_9STRA|nr:hypothetical protein PR001_g14103 [Phytophthora rubi]